MSWQMPVLGVVVLTRDRLKNHCIRSILRKYYFSTKSSTLYQLFMSNKNKAENHTLKTSEYPDLNSSLNPLKIQLAVKVLSQWLPTVNPSRGPKWIMGKTNALNEQLGRGDWGYKCRLDSAIFRNLITIHLPEETLVRGAVEPGRCIYYITWWLVWD